jgi:hypothetical protein
MKKSLIDIRRGFNEMLSELVPRDWCTVSVFYKAIYACSRWQQFAWKNNQCSRALNSSPHNVRHNMKWVKHCAALRNIQLTSLLTANSVRLCNLCIRVAIWKLFFLPSPRSHAQTHTLCSLSQSTRCVVEKLSENVQIIQPSVDGCLIDQQKGMKVHEQ